MLPPSLRRLHQPLLSLGLYLCLSQQQQQSAVARLPLYRSATSPSSPSRLAVAVLLNSNHITTTNHPRRHRRLFSFDEFLDPRSAVVFFAQIHHLLAVTDAVQIYSCRHLHFVDLPSPSPLSFLDKRCHLAPLSLSPPFSFAYWRTNCRSQPLADVADAASSLCLISLSALVVLTHTRTSIATTVRRRGCPSSCTADTALDLSPPPSIPHSSTNNNSSRRRDRSRHRLPDGYRSISFFDLSPLALLFSLSLPLSLCLSRYLSLSSSDLSGNSDSPLPCSIDAASAVSSSRHHR